MKVARSAQTCALGAAMAGAVAAGRRGDGHETFAAAQAAMGGVKRIAYKPNAARHKAYLELYTLYRQLHDAFGTRDWSGGLFNVMKDLLALKDRQRR
jgi:L-ribulokinase